MPFNVSKCATNACFGRPTLSAPDVNIYKRAAGAFCGQRQAARGHNSKLPAVGLHLLTTYHCHSKRLLPDRPTVCRGTRPRPPSLLHHLRQADSWIYCAGLPRRPLRQAIRPGNFKPQRFEVTWSHKVEAVQRSSLRTVFPDMSYWRALLHTGLPTLYDRKVSLCRTEPSHRPHWQTLTLPTGSQAGGMTHSLRNSQRGLYHKWDSRTARWTTLSGY